MNKFIPKKRIAMIVAMKDYRDEEYFIPKNVFLNAGFDVKTIGEEKGSALGVYGGVVKIDEIIDNSRADDFDALIFVGGSGALGLYENSNCLKLAKQGFNQGKIIGAICIAPIILAKAGILKGKQATVWQSDLDKSGIKILKDNGCEIIGQDVVVDGKIITANGYEAARKFAETVVGMLQG